MKDWLNWLRQDWIIVVPIVLLILGALLITAASIAVATAQKKQMQQWDLFDATPCESLQIWGSGGSRLYATDSVQFIVFSMPYQVECIGRR